MGKEPFISVTSHFTRVCFPVNEVYSCILIGINKKTRLTSHCCIKNNIYILTNDNFHNKFKFYSK